MLDFDLEYSCVTEEDHFGWFEWCLTELIGAAIEGCYLHFEE